MPRDNQDLLGLRTPKPASASRILRSGASQILSTQPLDIAGTSEQPQESYPFEIRTVLDVIHVRLCPIIALHPQNGWVLLHCEFCHGNSTKKGGYLIGLWGLRQHMTNSHPDLFQVDVTEGSWWDNCQAHTLDIKAIEDIVEDLKAGRSPIELRICSNLDLRHAADIYPEVQPDSQENAEPNPPNGLRSVLDPNSSRDLSKLVIIEHPHHGWVELRCPECGSNTKSKSVNVPMSGILGMRGHLSARHSDLYGKVSVDLVLDICAYELSAAELEQIQRNLAAGREVNAPPSKVARKSAASVFSPQGRYLEDDDEVDDEAEDLDSVLGSHEPGTGTQGEKALREFRRGSQKANHKPTHSLSSEDLDTL
ncbi:hypothetical protein EJ08DRAFT_356887 [Tothia fuscella]|uniref:Uncharacterized protein n=1 Tax=Tothia fuscella TaxID=1048955 RepID=A0A9P4NMF0_9PEZI|nr:hypothetical protein EJ08DRAFT_356887 [Tothia fuscella]